MIVAFHPDAEMELSESAWFYEQQVPELGERFVAEVERVVALLIEYPDIGIEVGPPGLRGFSLRLFPFTVMYTVAPGRLQILAVAHAKRRPGYWKSRT